MYIYCRWIFFFYLICLFVLIPYISINYQNNQNLFVIESSTRVNEFKLQRSVDQIKCAHRSHRSDQIRSSIIQTNSIFQYLTFVIQSHSIFYCSVPKVATRTILIYLTYLHIRDELIPSIENNSKIDIFNYPYIKQIIFSSFKNQNQTNDFNLIKSLEYFRDEYLLNNSTKIDLWSLYQNQVFPLVRLRSLSNPSRIFSSNYLRMIFVRHPLERLASAYIDKITSLNNQPFSLYDQMRRDICQKFASFYVKNLSDSCEKIIPKFEHFVEYLITSENRNDVHWKPYSSLCFVCLFDYNFIGKFETIENDLNRLKTLLNINTIQTSFFQNGKSKEFYRQMFSNFNETLICFLKKFYQFDLNLFNYTIDDYLFLNRTLRC